jgi:hypothetical protein
VISAPDLTHLSHAEKDALILALFRQLVAADTRIAARDACIAALVVRPQKGVPVLAGRCIRTQIGGSTSGWRTAAPPRSTVTGAG